MKKITRSLLIATCNFMFIFQQSVTAQETKKEKKESKNSIHFNVTNLVIFGGKSIVFGYERVLNKNHSFTVNLGTAGFPTFNIVNSDSLKAHTIRDHIGVNISADYRIYLLKENKYPAPRGVYIGPYYSYNYFEKKHDWSLKSTSGSTSNIESELKLNVHTIGFELGYQFIFWDRLTLDMIMLGPGIAVYNLKATLDANLPAADKEKLFDALNEALAGKLPGYRLVVNESEFKKTGIEKTTSFGYRFMIQIGFRF